MCTDDLADNYLDLQQADAIPKWSGKLGTFFLSFWNSCSDVQNLQPKRDILSTCRIRSVKLLEVIHCTQVSLTISGTMFLEIERSHGTSTGTHISLTETCPENFFSKNSTFILYRRLKTPASRNNSESSKVRSSE